MAGRFIGMPSIFRHQEPPSRVAGPAACGGQLLRHLHAEAEISVSTLGTTWVPEGVGRVPDSGDAALVRSVARLCILLAGQLLT